MCRFEENWKSVMCATFYIDNQCDCLDFIIELTYFKINFFLKSSYRHPKQSKIKYFLMF